VSCTWAIVCCTALVLTICHLSNGSSGTLMHLRHEHAVMFCRSFWHIRAVWQAGTSVIRGCCPFAAGDARHVACQPCHRACLCCHERVVLQHPCLHSCMHRCCAKMFCGSPCAHLLRQCDPRWLWPVGACTACLTCCSALVKGVLEAWPLADHVCSM
jgi:hypothetical protein